MSVELKIACDAGREYAIRDRLFLAGSGLWASFPKPVIAKIGLGGDRPLSRFTLNSPNRSEAEFRYSFEAGLRIDRGFGAIED